MALLREILNDPKTVLEFISGGELEDLQHLGKGLIDIAKDEINAREEQRRIEREILQCYKWRIRFK